MVQEIKETNIFLKVLRHADLSENAYLSYDYFKVFLKYNPPRHFLCYCLKDAEEKVIGLLPLIQTGLCYEILGYRASNYLGYICAEADTERVDSEISEYIKTNYPGMVINFYDINSAVPLYAILKDRPFITSTHLYDCPFVDVNQDFESLFTTQVKKSKRRTELRKFANKVEVVGKVEMLNIDDTESWNNHKKLIPGIYKIHRERFKDIYIPNDLCLHKNEAYYTELFESLVAKNKALLSILTVDDVPVSFLYTVISDGIVMDWMPAFDPAFSKYSLGTVHLMKLLEYLCQHPRYRILDFSKGAAVYKARWAKNKTDNYMFVRRYSSGMVPWMKSFCRVFPIKLKSFLRRKGILERIKSVIGKLKKRPAANIQNESASFFDIVKEFPAEVKETPFSYSKIEKAPTSIKSQVLSAIYVGAKPILAYSENNFCFIMVNENSIEDL